MVRPAPHGLRHPQIFYYGHTPCLYINKLRVSGVLSKPVNAYFESIFEVGVDEMLWDDMHKNDMLWPTVSEVNEYRKQVYETVANAIMTHPSLDDSDGPVTVNQDHPMWALFMGFEHERIHFETSSVLFRETPYHLVQVRLHYHNLAPHRVDVKVGAYSISLFVSHILQTPKNWPSLHPSAGKETVRSNPVEGVDYPTTRMIPGRKDTVDLGKPPNFPSFGWDNEYGERSVDVPDFLASEHMITNGEYWEFVAEGGYRSKEFWCDDGWAWRTHRNMKWPFFWQPAGPAVSVAHPLGKYFFVFNNSRRIFLVLQGSHEYTLRTIFKLISMPWDWPVDVNYYEAKAFCRWKVSG
jgi:5-histidylcysteine sulfoxide synthase